LIPFPKNRGILFDLDGTLVDSLDDLAAAANHVRSIRNLKPLSRARVASYIGEGVRSLVSKVLKTVNSRELDAMVPLFVRHYEEHCVDFTRLYPGVARALKTLHGAGYKLAVVTNKPGQVSRRILRALGVFRRFQCVLGGDSAARKKPDPQLLIKACKVMKLKPETCIMVGDSRVDMEAGRAAGMKTIGIKGGIGNLRLLKASKPDLLLPCLPALVKLLLRF
jgi:phosphoglycolate phosphatase